MSTIPDDRACMRHQAAVFLRSRDSLIPRGLRRNLRDLERDKNNYTGVDRAVAWRDGHTKGLVLTGTMGVGKTSIAAAAAWERELSGKMVYVSVPLLLAHLDRAFGDPRRDLALDALTAGGGLVLDDLDKVKASAATSAKLFAAIDSRIQLDAPLLVTMNRTLGELAEKLGHEYGGPIASRLAGYCEIVFVGGPDRRLNGRRE